MAETTGNGDPWQPLRGADPARLRLLGELLRMRRAAIGYRHVPAFTAKRGINTRMAGDIEHGRRDTYTFPSLQDVAAAYEVTYDSVMAVVWSGAGELVPAGDEPREPRALPSAPPGDPGDPPGWPPARVAADRPFFDPINERRVELAARGIAYPTGAQMFGEGTDDAEAWDGDFAPLPVGDKVWAVADMRRRAAGAAGTRADDRGA